MLEEQKKAVQEIKENIVAAIEEVKNNTPKQEISKQNERSNNRPNRRNDNRTYQQRQDDLMAKAKKNGVYKEREDFGVYHRLYG